MMETQTLWHNVSDLGHSGILVAEIIEVVGYSPDSPNPSARHFLPTLDGGFILPCAILYFPTKTEALLYINSNASSFTVLETH